MVSWSKIPHFIDPTQINTLWLTLCRQTFTFVLETLPLMYSDSDSIHDSILGFKAAILIHKSLACKNQSNLPYFIDPTKIDTLPLTLCRQTFTFVLESLPLMYSDLDSFNDEPDLLLKAAILIHNFSITTWNTCKN